MSEAMFGLQAGTRLWEKDQAELSRLAAATELGKAQTTHQLALSELNRAQAKTMLRKSEREDETAELLAIAARGEAPAGAASGSPTDPIQEAISVQMRQGLALLRAGKVEEGGKIVNDAAGQMQKLSGATANAALEARRRALTDLAVLDYTEQVLTGVTDQASYDRAMMVLRQNPLTAAQLQQTPLSPRYDPRMVNALLAGSKAAKEKRELQLREAESAATIADKESAIAAREARTAQGEARTQAYVTRQTAVEKAGGDRSIGTPGSKELNAVNALLKARGVEVTSDTRTLLETQIAEDAMAISRRNPAITESEAREMALADAMARGDIEPRSWGRKPTYKGTPGSAARPLPPPKTRADLKPGRYYRDSDGSIKRFTGTAFELVSGPPKSSRPAPAARPPVDEEDEE